VKLGSFSETGESNHAKLTYIYICKGVWGLTTQPARINVHKFCGIRVEDDACTSP
jgi:hypothetical protein